MGGFEGLKDTIIMSPQELELYENLNDEAYKLLDDFNFRRIQSVEELQTALKNAINDPGIEITDIELLQILQYRRVSNYIFRYKENLVLQACEFLSWKIIRRLSPQRKSSK